MNVYTGGTTLCDAARRFLVDDLISNSDIVPWTNTHHWNQSAASYYGCFRRFSTRVCGGCSYQGDAGKFFVRVSLPGTQEEWDAAVTGVCLSDKVLECLSDGTRTNVVWLWGHVAYGTGNTGHAILVLFDKRAKLQIVYDPHSGANTRVSIVRALCRHQFHPSFSCATEETCTWSRLADSTQERCIGVISNVPHQGVCGLMCMVALAACVRFNFFNPKVLMDFMTPQLTVIANINRIIGWYEGILTQHWAPAKVQQRMLPSSTEQVCRVFSPSTGRLCSRKSCRVPPGGTHEDDYTTRHMCWQHRFLNINRRASGPGSKTCASPQMGC